jgi:hypothetical protein
MDARPLKLAWLVPILALAVLPVTADAASRASHSSHSSSSHPKTGTNHKNRSHSKKCSTCARSSHGRIKRSEKTKHDFMRQTGYSHGRPGYVVDHKVALECGGADVPSNMQWQTVAEARAKDKTERTCR